MNTISLKIVSSILNVVSALEPKKAFVGRVSRRITKGCVTRVTVCFSLGETKSSDKTISFDFSSRKQAEKAYKKVHCELLEGSNHGSSFYVALGICDMKGGIPLYDTFLDCSFKVV